MDMFIGIDMGGTNIRVAKVDANGNIIQQRKEPTEIVHGTKHVMQKIIRMIESIDNYAECKGIGLGVPGPVDPAEGKMLLATNLPGFEGYPIAKEIEQHFHKPTFLENDGNVAGLGEAILGAGKGKGIVYYVTISTGIGGACIIHQKVISGKNGHAGEIGNLIVDRNRDKVNNLNIGAIENEASGTALTRKAKKIFGEDVIHHAGDLFQLAREKDEKALALVDEMAYDIAVMLSLIAHVVDPDIFIIGGGVMQGKDVFFEKVEKNYRTLIHNGMQSVLFAQAELEEPGIVGAAMLPMAYLSK